MTIAIITGASSGLGREYAKLLDEENVGEIWLISVTNGPYKKQQSN